MLRIAAALLCLTLAAACTGQATTGATGQADAPANRVLQQQIEAITHEPAVARAHWGLSVTTLSGAPIAALNDGQFFQPASNAKLFTTAAAMALLPLNERLHTRVLGAGILKGGVFHGDLILEGAGDANFSGRPVPYMSPQPGVSPALRDEFRYIDELADSVKAQGIRSVEGDIHGDDSLFGYQPYPPDWSLDDLVWYYGAPINALTIADNSVTVTVAPGKRRDTDGRGFTGGWLYDPVTITMDPDLPYYIVDAEGLRTHAEVTTTHIDFERTPGSRTLHLRGVMASGSKPYVQAISIDDPAEYAALALKRSLESRGVAVHGQAYAQHGRLVPAESTDASCRWEAQPKRLAPLQAAATLTDLFTGTDLSPDCESSPAPPLGKATCQLAEHLSPPLYEDIIITNKTSQNQHAELLLRLLDHNVPGDATTPSGESTRFGKAKAGGSTAGGVALVRRYLTEQAGVDPQDFYFNDGSGLSTHDLVTPRAITQLLRYAATQPWGAQWKASLPVGGVDGSLRSRFPNAPLKNHVFAKTGTLGEARALSGYLDAASGQTIVFSIMVSTHTPLNNEDEKAMDRIVAAIAAAE